MKDESRIKGDALKEERDEIDCLSSRILSEEGFASHLISEMEKDGSSRKFTYERAIRRACEIDPGAMAAHFRGIIALLSGNTFLRAGAVISLSLVIPFLPPQNAGEAVDAYFAVMRGDSLISAGNAVKFAHRVVRALPELEGQVTDILASIPERTYLSKGKPSPECRNVMIGCAIECMGEYFDIARDKVRLVRFAQQALSSRRGSTARKAEIFLKMASERGRQ